MDTPLIGQLLLVMENLYVVAAMTLVAIALRWGWARYRAKHPLPIPPHAVIRQPDPLLELLEMALFIPAVALFLTVPVHPLLRMVCAVGGYLAMTYGLRLLWKRYRAGHPLPTPSGPLPPKGIVLELLDTIVIALVLVFGLVRPFLMSTYFIPSGSMTPTLMGPTDLDGRTVPGGGDRLIANRFVYRVGTPRRGDIVVFNPPAAAFIGNNPAFLLDAFLAKDPAALGTEEMTVLRDAIARQMPNAFNRYNLPTTLNGDPAENAKTLRALLPELPELRDAFIKRIIGVPGDRIRMSPEDGILINGKPLDEPYLSSTTPHTTFAFPTEPPRPTRVPTLADVPEAPNVGGQTLDPRNYYALLFTSWLSQWYRAEIMYPERIAPHVDNGEFVVPQSYYFLMGDNRHEGGSFDSRYWGVVPQSAIKGRAVCTFWPFPPFAPAERLKNLH